MIIIPELQTVVITPPRTASTSVRLAIRHKYPMAWMPYRHMEVAGIPYGYEKWTVVGVVRAPLSRLWSLYCYCKNLSEDKPFWVKGRAEQIRDSVERYEFPEWLEKNHTVFATAINSAQARYATKYPLPENGKSQVYYYRDAPPENVLLFKFTELQTFASRLGLDLPHTNGSYTGGMEPPKNEIAAAVKERFRWDRIMAGGWWDDEVPKED
jgi:hypothetical protein